MKQLAILFILLTTYSVVYSQNEYENEGDFEVEGAEELNQGEREVKDWVRNFRFGGEAGFFLSTIAFRIDFTPMVGYQIVPNWLEVGVGLPTSYYRENGIDYKYNFIGFMGYGRVYVWNNMFAQVEGLTGRFRVTDRGVPTNIQTGNVFAGAGYRTPIGDRFWMDFGLKINLLENNVYRNRWPSPFFTFFYGL